MQNMVWICTFHLIAYFLMKHHQLFQADETAQNISLNEYLHDDPLVSMATKHKDAGHDFA